MWYKIKVIYTAWRLAAEKEYMDRLWCKNVLLETAEDVAKIRLGRWQKRWIKLFKDSNVK